MRKREQTLFFKGLDQCLVRKESIFRQENVLDARKMKEPFIQNKKIGGC